MAFRLPVELVVRVDARCVVLGQSRTRFVVRALERALGPVDKAPASEVVPEPVSRPRSSVQAGRGVAVRDTWAR